MELTFWISILAGLASFLSPCVLSLVPAYVGYLGGRSISAAAENENDQRNLNTFLHGVFFVFGFSTVFILLGLSFSIIGTVLYDARIWIMKVGGIVVILFGLHISGILNIPLLNYDIRPRSDVNKRQGYLSSFLMGIFFSAGWSPCVGPVLGSILMLAMNQANALEGSFLLIGYSIGFSIPFLLAALSINWVVSLIKRYKKVIVIFEKLTGYLLILIGTLLFLGLFETINRFGSFIDFGI